MPLMQSPPGAVTKIDGRECLYFVGTGYFGLQGHSELVRAACEAAQQFGIGSANSRTAFGTTPPLLDVERAAAAMFGVDDAFYFASGWMGGNVVMHAFGDAFAPILIDECSHYSLSEAARLSAQPTIAFRHRDPDDLRAKLKEHVEPGQRPLVLSDGVFAATGRIAPVADYVDLLSDYAGSALCLDDAHGIGVLGPNGRGTLEHCNTPRPLGALPGVRAIRTPNSFQAIDVPLPSPALPCPAVYFYATLSKAIGGFGGIIPGNRPFIDGLKSQSPYFGGASAPPPPIAAATARAIELVMADPSLRTRLWSNARLLKAGLRRLGFEADDTPTPVVCLTIGTADNMQRIQRELLARRIAIAYMAAYSGLGPEGGLRIAVFATHGEAMIEELLGELGRLI